jgi:hypothetical protein
MKAILLKITRVLWQHVEWQGAVVVVEVVRRAEVHFVVHLHM